MGLPQRSQHSPCGIDTKPCCPCGYSLDGLYFGFLDEYGGGRNRTQSQWQHSHVKSLERALQVKREPQVLTPMRRYLHQEHERRRYQKICGQLCESVSRRARLVIPISLLLA